MRRVFTTRIARTSLLFFAAQHRAFMGDNTTAAEAAARCNKDSSDKNNSSSKAADSGSAPKKSKKEGKTRVTAELAAKYRMDALFQEPTMRYYFDGIDSEFKVAVRDALQAVLPAHAHNFTHRQAPLTFFQNLQVLRALGAKRFVSHADISSSPRALLSFYEVLATCDCNLAMIAADHFTFASLLHSYGADELKQSAAAKQMLDGADGCEHMGTLAWKEAIADEPPLNCEARWDRIDSCFYLRGAAKVGVVSALEAEWALVTATVTLNKAENQGSFPLFVQLREKGQLRKGVRIEPLANESGFAAAGVGVVHFDYVVLPREALMRPYYLDSAGKIQAASDEARNLVPVSWLQHHRRLATIAIYVGALKRVLANTAVYVANREVIGYEGRRNYPYFALQHIQTPLAATVAKMTVYQGSYQRLLNRCCEAVVSANKKKKDTTTTSDDEKSSGAPTKQYTPNDKYAKKGESECGLPSREVRTQLTGLLYCLQELLEDAQHFNTRNVGLLAQYESFGMRDVSVASALRAEARDTSALIRDVTREVVVHSFAARHWFASMLVSTVKVGWVQRFVSNPFYSPSLPVMQRHKLFFDFKFNTLLTRLVRARETQRYRGEFEEAWFDWNVLRHKQVQHCGDAYMERFHVETMVQVLFNLTDDVAIQLFTQIGWFYVMHRIRQNLDYHIELQLLRGGTRTHIDGDLDNLAAFAAAQCSNLCSAFQVPRMFLSPGALTPEAYWAIPRTVSGLQRCDKVIVYDEDKNKKKDNGDDEDEKEAQEKMTEDVKEVDLLHGLGDAHPTAEAVKKS